MHLFTLPKEVTYINDGHFNHPKKKWTTVVVFCIRAGHFSSLYEAEVQVQNWWSEIVQTWFLVHRIVCSCFCSVTALHLCRGVFVLLSTTPNCSQVNGLLGEDRPLAEPWIQVMEGGRASL